MYRDPVKTGHHNFNLGEKILYILNIGYGWTDGQTAEAHSTLVLVTSNTVKSFQAFQSGS